jgi:hypothetical protein
LSEPTDPKNVLEFPNSHQNAYSLPLIEYAKSIGLKEFFLVGIDKDGEFVTYADEEMSLSQAIYFMACAERLLLKRVVP